MHLKHRDTDRLLLPRENRFDRIIKRIEEILFALIVITMIILGLTPIVLRYTGMMGISWTESLSQNMLLWVTFLGAGVAIRERSSISIDAAPHILNHRKRLALRGITEIVSALLCGILVWVSIEYVSDMLEYDSDSIAFLNIRAWHLALSLPIGFSLLAIRLFIAASEDIYHTFRWKKLLAEQEKNEESDKEREE